MNSTKQFGLLSYSLHQSVIDRYLAGETAKQLAEAFNVKSNNIYDILRKYKIPGRKRKYAVNESYFSEIDNRHKAYIFGYLIADGSNHKFKKSIVVELAQKDKHVLEYMRSQFFPNNDKPLYYSKPRIVSGSKSKSSGSYILEIDSTKLSDDLVKLGCGHNKTYEYTPVTIPQNYFGDFLRGVFDGDGCAHVNKLNHITISFVLNTNFANQIQNELKERDIKSFIYKHHNDGPASVLAISCSDTLKFYHLLYSNLSDQFCLERKRLKISEYLRTKLNVEV
jgi:hypothetical protein